MANRYWVGGSGLWSSLGSTKWATTSGGAGGASVPTASDNVFFDANSGASVVTIEGTRACLSLDATGFTGILDGINTPNLQVYENLTFGSGMTVANSLTRVSFLGVGSFTITTNGKSLVNVTFNNTGGTWTIQSALTATGTVTFTAGTFNANNFNVTIGSFSSSNSNVRALQMGNGTWTISSSGTFWNLATSTNMTLTRGTGTNAAIVSTGTTTKTFSGGGLTYPRLTQASGSQLFIVGNNTRFADLTRTHAGTTTITLTGGQTFLFDDFTLSGVSTANRTTFNSDSVPATISKSSGVVSVDFLAISRSTATGGATWYAGAGSTEGSDVTGWIFTTPSQGSGNMLMLFM